MVEGNETLEIEARRRAVEGYNERVVKDSKGNVLSVLRVCPGTSSGITKFSEHEAD